MSEVFPTDIVQRRPDAFAVGLQWPRRHPLYCADPVNSALVAEAIRQTTIYVCHMGYGVPLERRFLMTALGFRLERNTPGLQPGQAIEVMTTARGSAIRRTPTGALRSARIMVEFSDARGLIAAGYGDALLVDERTYGRIRGDHVSAVPGERHSALVTPESVGRVSSEDVVISREGGAFHVVVDGRNPFFFDHPLDHIPGVALIEACRQSMCLALDEPTADLQSFEGDFHRMVEFSAPNELRIVLGDEISFEIRQQGEVAVTASATHAANAIASVH